MYWNAPMAVTYSYITAPITVTYGGFMVELMRAMPILIGVFVFVGVGVWVGLALKKEIGGGRR